MESKNMETARPEQLPPPGDWRYWVIVTGRGWGRNWTGCRWLAQRALEGRGPMLLVGESYDNLRDRVIPEIIRVAGCPVEWKKTHRSICWPNGTQLNYIIGGADPDILRGGRWATVWARQPLLWPKLDEVWPLVDGGAFLPNDAGEPPRLLVTQSAPDTVFQQEGGKERVYWLKALMRRTDAVVVRGSMFDNSYLHPEFVRAIYARYLGTRDGRAIIIGEILMPEKKRRKK